MHQELSDPVFRIPKLVPVLLFLCLAFFAAAEDQQDAEKPWGITAFPVVAYSGDTGFMGGAYLLFYDYPSGTAGEGAMSSVSAFLIYTQNRQLQTGIFTDRYLANESMLLSGGFSFSRFPGNFYGLGPDSELDDEENYTPMATSLSLSLLGRISDGFYLGPAYSLAFLSVEETEEDGILLTDAPPGSDGGILSGLGVKAVYDSRDSSTFPRSGALIESRTIFYGPVLGSDASFAEFLLDARGYFDIGRNWVAAVQGYLSAVGDDAPFQVKPSLGGTSLMRGYASGRFIDDLCTVLQGELRFPIFGRLGGVAFAGIGNVAPSLAAYRFDSTKITGGGGIRIALQTEPRLNLRADIAVSPDGVDLTISVLEAF